MDRKIRILHVIDSLGAGGAEKLLDEMLPVLNEKKDVEIELLLLSREGNIFLNKIKKSSIKVSYSPINKPKNMRNIKYLCHFIKEGEFDIVHSHLFPENYFVAMVSFILRSEYITFVTTEHSTHNRRRDIIFMKLFEKIIYRNYDLVISITEATEEALIQWIDPKELEKYIVINNGVNIERFSNAKPYKKENLHNSFSKDTKLLCMVGRFSEQKDQKTIIQALTYLSDTVELVLVGEGEKKEELIRLAKNSRVEDRVKFLGIRNDVPEIYKTIDIPIVSSNWEGFGLVAVEGMASGKPVIASDVPGLSQIVKDYGILYEAGNAQELAEIIEKLLESGVMYKEIAKNCKRRSIDFDITKMIDSYYQEYLNLSDKLIT